MIASPFKQSLRLLLYKQTLHKQLYKQTTKITYTFLGIALSHNYFVLFTEHSAKLGWQYQWHTQDFVSGGSYTLLFQTLANK